MPVTNPTVPAVAPSVSFHGVLHASLAKRPTAETQPAAGRDGKNRAASAAKKAPDQTETIKEDGSDAQPNAAPTPPTSTDGNEDPELPLARLLGETADSMGQQAAPSPVDDRSSAESETSDFPKIDEDSSSASGKLGAHSLGAKTRPKSELAETERPAQAENEAEDSPGLAGSEADGLRFGELARSLPNPVPREFFISPEANSNPNPPSKVAAAAGENISATAQTPSASPPVGPSASASSMPYPITSPTTTSQAAIQSQAMPEHVQSLSQATSAPGKPGRNALSRVQNREEEPGPMSNQEITRKEAEAQVKPDRADANLGNFPDGAQIASSPAASPVHGPGSEATAMAGAQPLHQAGDRAASNLAEPDHGKLETSSDAGASSASSTTTATGSGVVQTAHVLERMGQSEMHVGITSSRFGNIELHTSVYRDHVGATIATNHAELRSALAAEMPNLEREMARHQLTLDRFRFDLRGGPAGGGSESQPHSQPQASSPERRSGLTAISDSQANAPVQEPIAASSATLNVHA